MSKNNAQMDENSNSGFLRLPETCKEALFYSGNILGHVASDIARSGVTRTNQEVSNKHSPPQD